ncbi:MAG: hypothetical protein A2Z49_11955 [Chloroflexi bacterium RBG_19FT_COMBO_56_12]|nr:MAG: hypothetical protein A2Z49_11955 [Chloroflexi bacterium RBG_19FT_COMBO_56_12]
MRLFNQRTSEPAVQLVPGERVFDAEQAREAVEALTPLRCWICRYPVMAAWKYCPGCGMKLIWGVAQNIKK